MEFNEKELRREISYAIKNIHGIRQVLHASLVFSSSPSKKTGVCKWLAKWPFHHLDRIDHGGGGEEVENPSLGSIIISCTVMLGRFQLEKQKFFTAVCLLRCTTGPALALQGLEHEGGREANVPRSHHDSHRDRAGRSGPQSWSKTGED